MSDPWWDDGRGPRGAHEAVGPRDRRRKKGAGKKGAGPAQRSLFDELIDEPGEEDLDYQEGFYDGPDAREELLDIPSNAWEDEFDDDTDFFEGPPFSFDDVPPPVVMEVLTELFAITGGRELTIEDMDRLARKRPDLAEKLAKLVNDPGPGLGFLDGPSTSGKDEIDKKARRRKRKRERRNRKH